MLYPLSYARAERGDLYAQVRGYAVDAVTAVLRGDPAAAVALLRGGRAPPFTSMYVLEHIISTVAADLGRRVGRSHGEGARAA